MSQAMPLPLSDVATLVQALVASLVRRPELVWVEELKNRDQLTIEVHVAPTDLLEVLGRHGHTLEAIRGALTRLANAQRPRYLLNIIGDRITWETSEGAIRESARDPLFDDTTLARPARDFSTGLEWDVDEQ